MNHIDDPFIHKPRGLAGGIFVHPVHTKVLWARVWDAARSQPWYDGQLQYVGNQDGWHYFQRPGVTTGYARVQLEDTI